MTINRLVGGIARRWLAVFIVVYGIWALIPFLAPILMNAGATGAGGAIYFFYGFICHQLPQRSLFLFGPKTMYSLAEIKAIWPYDDVLVLRQFVGNGEMGYKVAWSDRMIALFGSIWLGALLFARGRGKVKPLSVKIWLLIGILPMVGDGGSHLVNDILAGTSGTGFRDTNTWLRFLTGNLLPQSFYMGDALGSFNSDMRWLTGVLFGLTTVWFLFPYIERAMREPQFQAAAQPELGNVAQ